MITEIRNGWQGPVFIYDHPFLVTQQPMKLPGTITALLLPKLYLYYCYHNTSFTAELHEKSDFCLTDIPIRQLKYCKL